MTATRLSMEPVLRYFRARYPDDELTPEVIARHAGVCRGTARRWLILGVDVWQADRVATRIMGVHPCLVWPEWCEQVDAKVKSYARKWPGRMKEEAWPASDASAAAAS